MHIFNKEGKSSLCMESKTLRDVTPDLRNTSEFNGELLANCSDFRYESNGIFVLGVGFFSSDKFRLFN